jgi:hypothetical protein
MFNCLQEGILVIKQKVNDPTVEHGGQILTTQIYFVNEIADRILKKIFKTSRYLKSDKVVNKQNAHLQKIFYEFKNIQAQQLEKNSSDQSVS